MQREIQKIIVPELYGISIVLDILPGEIHSCATERGWWIRKKAVNLIERERLEDTFTGEAPPKNVVLDAIDLAVRYGYFWYVHKTCKSKFPLEIMKEIV